MMTARPMRLNSNRTLDYLVSVVLLIMHSHEYIALEQWLISDRSTPINLL